LSSPTRRRDKWRRRPTKFVIYVDSATEARMIITNAPYPSVLVTEAKKLFPEGENENDGQFRH